MDKGVLTFFCGKMGAGKSTKSSDIALERNAVLLSEDEWLESIYPNKIASLEDYIAYSNQLKPQMKKLNQAILVTGTDVVMDFPANTIAQREWFKNLYSEIDAPHELVYIDLSNENCLKQIKKRSIQQPERAATDTKEMFEAVTKHFIEPQPEEVFNVIRVQRNATMQLKMPQKRGWTR
jgi:shikimate kinase